MSKEFYLALASLIGTIIGAGIFGIPFVIAKSGVLPCLFYFLLLGAVALLLHLFFGEIVSRTKEKRRLVGYAEKYLGKKTRPIVAFAVVLGAWGSLLVYVILLGQFAFLVLPLLSAFQWSLFFWALLSFLVLLGIQFVSVSELLMNIGLFFAALLIFIFCLPHLHVSNFILIGKGNLLLPFGVMMFSLIGTSAIPEIGSLLKSKKELKKVIILGTIFCALFTLVFGLVTVAVSGKNTTQEALLGLRPILGGKVLILGGLFGLLAVATSFLIIGAYLKNTLCLDYRLPKFLAFFLACFAPLVLFLAGLRDFISVIGIVGVFVGLVEGVTISLIFWKIKKKKIAYFVIFFLALAAILRLIFKLT